MSSAYGLLNVNRWFTNARVYVVLHFAGDASTIAKTHIKGSNLFCGVAGLRRKAQVFHFSEPARDLFGERYVHI